MKRSERAAIGKMHFGKTQYVIDVFLLAKFMPLISHLRFGPLCCRGWRIVRSTLEHNTRRVVEPIQISVRNSVVMLVTVSTGYLTPMLL